jgi:hypothetical protein
VAEARAERLTLEYKQARPRQGMEQDKHELLGDVSSFAKGQR